MDDFAPCLIVLVVFGAAAFAFAIGARQSNNLKEVFKQLAARTGGNVDDGGWFGLPSVNFYHGHQWVRVDITKTGGKNSVYYTELHTAWPDASFRCEIYPEGIMQRIGKFLGMEDIEIGSPAFDRDYIITGSSPAILKDVLTGEAQMLIGQLRHLLGNREIYINIKGGTLLVKKKGRIAQLDTLNRFVDLSLQLLEATTGYQQGGIEFLEQSATIPPTAPTCQICGEAIFVERVICSRCKTPHHRDCWEFYGACSTYACGGKKFVYAARN